MEQFIKDTIHEEVRRYIVFLDQSKTPVDSADHLSQKFAKSFIGKPQTVKLLAGLNLCRFCASINRYYFSDCWIDNPTMQEIMTSFRAVGAFDAKFKKDLIRNHLAILYEWNKLDYRVKIELKQDMIAYIGTIGSQKVFLPVKSDIIAKNRSDVEKLVEHRIGHRIGGHLQYVVPRLAKMPFNQKENQLAKVVHFSPI